MHEAGMGHVAESHIDGWEHPASSSNSVWSILKPGYMALLEDNMFSMCCHLRMEKKKIRYASNIQARLVAKVFTQTFGVDYEETFPPVADIRDIRIFIAIAAYYDYEICGNSDAELQVKCYCNAGFETDRDDMKSQTRYVFTLNGGVVVWKSSKQSTTAQHAIEAEYIAAAEAAKEAVWIRKFVDKLGIVPSNNYPIEMNYNNTVVISMAKEPGIMKGARHYQRKFHYVCECAETGKIEMVKVHTNDNLTDPFTKALAG
nr:putative retrotransposon protein [Tanacetum cinerariifolium]